MRPLSRVKRTVAAVAATTVTAGALYAVPHALAGTDFDVTVGDQVATAGEVDDVPTGVTATKPDKYDTQIYAYKLYDLNPDGYDGASKTGTTHLKGWQTAGASGYGFCIQGAAPTNAGQPFEATAVSDAAGNDPRVEKYFRVVEAVQNLEGTDIDAQKASALVGADLTPEQVVTAAQFAIWHLENPEFQWRTVTLPNNGGKDVILTSYDARNPDQILKGETNDGRTLQSDGFTWYMSEAQKWRPKLSYDQSYKVFELADKLVELGENGGGGVASPANLTISDEKAVVDGDGTITFNFAVNGQAPADSTVVAKRGDVVIDNAKIDVAQGGDKATATITIPAADLENNSLNDVTVEVSAPTAGEGRTSMVMRGERTQDIITLASFGAKQRVKRDLTFHADEVAGTLKTTVGVNGKKASADAPVEVTAEDAAKGVDVVDTIDYTGLKAGQTYLFEGTLVEVTDGEAGQEIATAKTTQKVEKADGTVEVTFSNVQGLEPGKSYVVFEKATPVKEDGTTPVEGGKVIEHKDPKDKSQTLTVNPKVVEPTLKTTVTADGTKATAEAPVEVTAESAEKGVNVVDTIDYTGLKAGQKYTFEGSLVEVTDGKAGKVVKTAKTTKVVEEADGSVDVDFGSVEGLEADKTYVVFEKATPVGDDDQPVQDGKVIEHKDPSDKSQTIKVAPKAVEPTLKTTVTADGTKATAEAPVEVTAEAAEKGITVVDTIDYTGLKAGQKYTFEGSLVEVTDGKAGKVVKTAKTTKVVDSADGSVDVDFGSVEGLEADKTYVVFEKATPVGDDDQPVQDGKVIEHKDPSDKSQTIKVAPKAVEPTLKTTVTADGTPASAEAPVEVTAEAAEKGVNVVDTIDYTGLKAGKKYQFTGTLMNVTDGKAVTTKTVTETVATADGSVKVDFGTVKGLEADKTYVVFEEAVQLDDSDKPVDDTKVEHKDPADKAQTIVVKPKAAEPTLKTTVTANGTPASAEAPVEVTAEAANKGVNVVDTIDYTGLTVGQKYTFEGSLVEVTDGVAGKVVATAKTTEVVNSADGAVKVDFGSVKGLEADKTYVVFEKATPVGDDDQPVEGAKVIEHKDPSDKAQTIKVTPAKPAEPTTPAPAPNAGSLKTTVSADGTKASAEAPVEVTADAADKGVAVVDTIDYTGLVAGKKYQFSGTLMNVTDNKIVAEKTVTETVATADGSVKVDFGTVKGLEPGKTYVVFEEAVQLDGSDKPVEGTKVEHKDPTDKSQTILVTPKPAEPTEPTKPSEKPTEPAPAPSESTPAPKPSEEPTKPAEPTEPTKPAEPTEPTTPVEPTEPAPAPSESTPAPKPSEEPTTPVEPTEPAPAPSESTPAPTPSEEPTTPAEPTEPPPAPNAGELKTTVSANGRTATAEAPVTVTAAEVAAGITVVDSIDYTGLEEGKTYTFTGTLVDATDNNKVVATATTTTVVEAANGTVEVNFGTVTGLNPAHRYVVFEKAVNTTEDGTPVEGAKVITHENPADKAQTIQVEPKPAEVPEEGVIKTTVTAGEAKASTVKPAEITAAAASAGVVVVDTIDYSNLIVGATYRFDGRLVDVTDNNTVVATGTTTTTIATANGSVEVSFGTVKGLKAGHKYVVFETATQVTDNGTPVEGAKVLEHNDPTDTAQTIVVGEKDGGNGSSKPKIPGWAWVIPFLPLIPIIGGGSSTPEAPAPAQPEAPAPGAEVPSKGIERPGTPVKGVERPGTPVKGVERPGTPVKGVERGTAAEQQTKADNARKLANTGADVNVLVGIALLVLLAGAGAVAFGRRRA